MSEAPPTMSSNRPYLLRAMHEWIVDNGMSPHLLVDAGHEGLRVPPQAVKDGRVVLNIAARAVTQLQLGPGEVRFMARFSGVSHAIVVPIAAVLAIYAAESGQGMGLAPDPPGTPETAEAPSPPRDPQEDGAKRGAHLRLIK